MKSNGYHDHCDLGDLQKRFLNPDEGRYIDDWQRTIIAAIVVEDAEVTGGYRFLADFHTVRGYGGCTNLTVSCDSELREELPGLINAHGWTWAEWTGR